MYISREEYNKRERFETNFDCDFDTFAERINLPIGIMFLAKTIWGSEKLVKVQCEFAQIHFDIRECDETGEPLKYGYRRGYLHKREIAERLFEGDWKIYHHQTLRLSGEKHLTSAKFHEKN